MSPTHQRDEQGERAAAAREHGIDFFRDHPDALMAAAHRQANLSYGTRYEADAFVDGFAAGRRQRDEYLRENALIAKATTGA